MRTVAIMSEERARYFEILDYITNGTREIPKGCSFNKGMLVLSQKIETLKELEFNIGVTSPSYPSTANQMEANLNKSDAFVVTHILASVGHVPSTTDYLNLRDYLYPAENVFSTNTNNLYALYNGLFDLIVGSTTVQKNIAMKNNLRISTAQEGTAVSTVANTGVLQSDGMELFQNAKQEVQPFQIFNGALENKIKYNPPKVTGTTAVDLTTASATNFLRLHLFGYIVGGGGNNSSLFNFGS
jgi:hypothetical protein